MTMSTSSVEIIEISSTDSSIEFLLGKPAFFKPAKVAIANIELVKEVTGIQNHEEPLFDEFILPTQKSSTVTSLCSSSSISTHCSDIQYSDCDGNN
jgi:hypothetical protein